MKKKLYNIIRRRLSEKRNDHDWVALQRLKEKLEGIPRYTPGRVSVAGWDLEYTDSVSLIESFDVIVVRRWNDFSSTGGEPIILDCGANIGVSVLHYKRLFPRARIIAFEPDASACARLQRNLAANHIKDVTVVQAAVWKEKSRHRFFSSEADASRLIEENIDSECLSSLAPKSNIRMVDTVRLADYLPNGTIEFVKMDIEGAECEVIVDCGERLKSIRSMTIEFHYWNARPAALALTLATLADAGFWVSVNSYYGWVDLLHKTATPPDTRLVFDQLFLICAWRS